MMTLDKYREELKAADGFYDEVEESEGKSDFKDGKQLVYIDNHNMFRREADQALMLVLDIKGCDRDNKDCQSAQFFRIVSPDEGRIDENARKQGTFIFSFMRGLGIRFTPSQLEDIIPQIIMKKFYADIRVKEGRTGGKKFVNVYPLGFANDSQVEEETKDTPF
jgi:hypothetical protein